ncbi:hypothetical protein GCM10010387_50270 [Streptomyces inusitatus]|uniref:Uncharacterized protein n=1 Tax=Streptomyces inusitatus TaxID=68221 RepID=A0A918QJF7_9ACTN|nr:hypothetical protein [Streptomyces inusitatus]GGZ49917.1 hypothetical protein GCM10010387_50270 [Streptomyces inusitatus]
MNASLWYDGIPTRAIAWLLIVTVLAATTLRSDQSGLVRGLATAAALIVIAGSVQQIIQGARASAEGQRD